MPGPRVVALGDSITLGVGDGVEEHRGDAGWAALCARALGAQSFTNVAANGARARDLRAHQLPAALAWDPDVVLLTAGGNDVMRGDFSAAELERELAAVLTALARPGRRIVTVSLDRIGLFDLAPSPVARAMARRIGLANAAITRAIAPHRVDVVDGARLLASHGRSAWHIDRIHPSPLGHRALARDAVAALSDQWRPVADVPAAPPRPQPIEVAAWLVVHGTPWAIKRSRDLLPQVTRVVAAELHADYRARRATASRAGHPARAMTHPGTRSTG